MGGSSGSNTQTTEPWGGQRGFLEDVFRQSRNVYSQGNYLPYQGETVAPFSPHTQYGMDMVTERALGGDPAQDAYGNLLTGNMLQPNLDPYAMAGGGFDAMSGIAPGQDMMYTAGMSGPSYFDAYGMSGAGYDVGFPDAAMYAGGLTDPYATSLMQQSGYGGLNDASQYYGSMTGGAPMAGFDELNRTASGQYLNSNPYLDQMYDTASQRVVDRFQEDIMPSLSATFSSAGRTGGGIHGLMAGRAAGDAAGELSGLASDIYGTDYANERGRQVDAAAQLGQYGLQSAGQAADLYLGDKGLATETMGEAGRLALGGGQLASDLYGTGTTADISRLDMANDMYYGGFDRMLSAGSGMTDAGLGGMQSLNDLYGDVAQNQLQSAAMVPALREMQYGDADQLLRIGGMTEDQAQRLIDSDMQYYNQLQQGPWQNLRQYANLIYGLPSGYGVTTGPEQPGLSRTQGAMSGAMMGASVGGPYGALIGGAAGYMMT